MGASGHEPALQRARRAKTRIGYRSWPGLHEDLKEQYAGLALLDKISVKTAPVSTLPRKRRPPLTKPRTGSEAIPGTPAAPAFRDLHRGLLSDQEREQASGLRASEARDGIPARAGGVAVVARGDVVQDRRQDALGSAVDDRVELAELGLLRSHARLVDQGEQARPLRSRHARSADREPAGVAVLRSVVRPDRLAGHHVVRVEGDIRIS